MKFDHDTLRARFREAQAEKAVAEAALEPLIAEREALLAQVRPLEAQLKAVEARLMEARKPVYDLACEIGAIAKFFRGPDGKSVL